MATSGASAVGVLTSAPATMRAQRSALSTTMRALGKDWLTMAALAFLVTVVFCAIFADQLVQLGIIRDPNTQSLLLRNKPPGFVQDGTFRIFGTDQLGRDL